MRCPSKVLRGGKVLAIGGTALLSVQWRRLMRPCGTKNSLHFQLWLDIRPILEDLNNLSLKTSTIIENLRDFLRLFPFISIVPDYIQSSVKMSFVSILFSWYTWAGLIALPILVLLQDLNTWRSMPPGPIPLPFIGNKLPKNKPVSTKLFLSFAWMSKRYVWGPQGREWFRIDLSDSSYRTNQVLICCSGFNFKSGQRNTARSSRYVSKITQPEAGDFHRCLASLGTMRDASIALYTNRS